MQRTPPPGRPPPQVVESRSDETWANQTGAMSSSGHIYYDSSGKLIQQQTPGPYVPQMQEAAPLVYYNQSYRPIPQYSGQIMLNHNASYVNPLPIPQQQSNQGQAQVGAKLQVGSQYLDSNFPALPKPNEWKTVGNYRKRLRSPEQSRTYKQKKMSDYWLNSAIEINNSFTPLAEDGETKTTEENEEPTEHKPPPIFVDGVKNIRPLMEVLDTVAKDSYIIKTINTDQVKIQPKTGENYSNIVKALKQKETDFHTYKPKQDRSFRVVMKGLHASTDIDRFKVELEKLGHSVVNISNIKHRVNKSALPMFYVELKQKENNKEVYKIDKIMNSIIQFEAPHTKREIPQCAKCQRYGHTKNFCNKPPRCVKCTGNHSTTECSRKAKDQEVKCVNCGENHPANYRGCLVHKQLQQRLYPALRDRNNVQSNQNDIQNSLPTQTVQPGITYAQQASQPSQIQFGNHHSQDNQANPGQKTNEFDELKHMMKQLMEQMGTMLNLLTTLISKIA